MYFYFFYLSEGPSLKGGGMEDTENEKFSLLIGLMTKNYHQKNTILFFEMLI